VARTMAAMRVVQVSAHYPPNFVSGGTLVPQRIAQGMAARGHEVFVYAGHLDESRPPLSTWSEPDGHGVTVRWVVTTPWTSWSDPRNYDNADVVEDFAGWLDEVRPDVVHLHSLQTLGGGLVGAAKDSGAVTVLTMHDFWWLCARQFLVDRTMRPCPLVVDCGECPCQVDHAWLRGRDAWLTAQADRADVILAPSRIAARLLAANGVDESKLRVDENGVPGVGTMRLRSAAERVTGAPAGVRFMYAGGADPMKGLPVLLDSLAQVVPVAPWTADLYGAGSLPSGLGESVRSLPPYTPDRLSDVLAEHDVLILPSVMRESHSIVTREALAAGLAVICTDTLGPEEAVEHGRNGLVVPAGDAKALAHAIERFVGDPAMVRRMRAELPTSGLRKVLDQVEGLEKIYGDCIAGTLQEPHDSTIRAQDGLLNRILFVSGIQGAPLRYRAHLPAEALRLAGAHCDVRHYRDPDLPRLADEADAVVLYRVPATAPIIALVERIRARARPIPILFDVDDLIFDPTLEGEVHGLDGLDEHEHSMWWRGVARYRTTMELADLYVGSTQALCDHAARTTGIPVRRFRNGVGQSLAKLSERALSAPRSPGPLRIGYFSGTTTHDADWARIEPAVVQVMEAYPDLELWLVGHLTTTAELDTVASRIKRLPMLPWYELPRRLRDVDVNLAPLVPDSVFNEAKSAIKWLEAALVATPTIATPTATFREVIETNRTGMLATSVDEWKAALTLLLDDEASRVRIGTQARREALLTLSPHRQSAEYRAILRDAAHIVRQGGRRRTSNWEPVYDEEPLSAAEAWIDPYPGRLGVIAPALIPAGAAARMAAVARVYRTSGVRGIVAKTWSTLKRTLEAGRHAGHPRAQ
jgi:glycosyltransferase involved in cell wall biosynthesis